MEGRASEEDGVRSMAIPNRKITKAEVLEVLRDVIPPGADAKSLSKELGIVVVAMAKIAKGEKDSGYADRLMWLSVDAEDEQVRNAMILGAFLLDEMTPDRWMKQALEMGFEMPPNWRSVSGG